MQLCRRFFHRPAPSVFVETYGSEQGVLTADDITDIVKLTFDCRPGAIGKALQLREPKYVETAAYCHFGREPRTENGIKYFEWENPRKRALKCLCSGFLIIITGALCFPGLF